MFGGRVGEELKLPPRRFTLTHSGMAERVGLLVVVGVSMATRWWALPLGLAAGSLAWWFVFDLRLRRRARRLHAEALVEQEHSDETLLVKAENMGRLFERGELEFKESVELVATSMFSGLEKTELRAAWLRGVEAEGGDVDEARTPWDLVIVAEGGSE